MRRAVTVLATGPQALVEDLGRPGNAHLGVPPSGALDAPALRLANRLVGNAEGAAGIETLMGGLRLRAECSCTVAVTGPSVAVRTAGRGAGSHVPVHLGAGEELEIGAPELGLRCYVGISGGIEVPLELGSRATDVLSGIGPDPLEPGEVLPLGGQHGPPVGVDELAPEQPPNRLAVPVLLGPRDDWFDRPAEQLAGAEWTVSAQSNRVGLRLAGPALRRAGRFADLELPSEGVITGAVQVPAGGRPVIFLADHPTTGGYPVIAVVRPDALPALAQARPGTRVRFRPVS
ncbi:MAG TPA: biotin-dependent carboxyltransferase family protein [Actinophytocola sp.]|uniref:5-oxoprolinase subunit C family protein n=1 Tax=Actinophytocola sp. TaxID=1872138 RepID=UPI002DDCA5A0|nr:biotin-dependent carboxyltransferase family protein [Actinophytocola sp.]HEV2783605.1 biotin-dependent carboxyltransferase family protein [Actinophytocola sp.]